MPLCPPCQELYDGWLEYKQPATKWVHLNNEARSIEARKARIQETRDLQRQQLDMIRDTCNRKHQESEAVTLTPEETQTVVDALNADNEIPMPAPEIHYTDSNVTLWHGDCVDVLRGLPDNSVDSVVTDPPYGIRFMGKSWDGEDIEEMTAKRRAAAPMPDGVGGPNGGYQSASTEAGRYRQNLTANQAFGEWCLEWTRECFRVLKPGGHILAFGGSRTWHRLASAVEDAGFEIRDSIAWLYGSGFPKSMDISKAIDRMRHEGPEKLKVTSWLADQADKNGVTRAMLDAAMGTSDMGGWWLSRLEHRCQVPTMEQIPRVLETLGVASEDVPEDIQTLIFELNGAKGTPGKAWLEREVIGQRETGDALGWLQQTGSTAKTVDVTAAHTEAAKKWEGWGTTLKPSFEPVVVGRKPMRLTTAANVMKHGTGGMNIAATRVGGEERTNKAGGASSLSAVTRVEQGYRDTVSECEGTESTVSGRWPTNVILDPFTAELLNEQEANADQFFPVFRYNPKAPASERPSYDKAGGSGGTIAAMRCTGCGKQDLSGTPCTCENPTWVRDLGNKVSHPTVKPLDLMRWLIRLVTPPGGTVLEPFAGSGTTAEAAVMEGMQCIAIEREADYLPLIRQRLEKPIEVALFQV
ncbi:DNA methyltransferase [Arthrobacter phage DrYang]|uniref:DNA methylase n=1 Tax=Arthrobacter phage DrYang TaxID=2686080 RepID=A0A6B9J8H1_9CAUD|nr:DNA methyltransferase [Arthrobacter phage DrYang]QGZ17178.1 DNA methylase [Arthrobacter phage DrYang]